MPETIENTALPVSAFLLILAVQGHVVASSAGQRLLILGAAIRSKLLFGLASVNLASDGGHLSPQEDCLEGSISIPFHTQCIEN